jgi:hypothetical protein
LVAPDESARFRKATPIRAVAAGHATFRYASLRAARGVHPTNRTRKVQEGEGSSLSVRVRDRYPKETLAAPGGA